MNDMDAKDHVASEDVRKWKIEGRIVDDDMIDFLVRVVERRHEGSPCRFMGKPERKACRIKVSAGTEK